MFDCVKLAVNLKETIERKIMRYIAKVGSFIDENDVVYPACIDFNAKLGRCVLPMNGMGLVADLDNGVEWEDLSDEFLETLVA
jgi:hypothetical protein